MTTMSKKKMNRWQAALLAGLVVAGGALAVPQAANAASASTKTATCTSYASNCSTNVTARHGIVVIKATDPWMSKHAKSYTVKASSGRTLCSGMLLVNGGARECQTGANRGTVKLTVGKDASKSIRIAASY